MGSDMYLNPPRSDNAGLKAKAKIEALEALGNQIVSWSNAVSEEITKHQNDEDTFLALSNQATAYANVLRAIDEQVAKLCKIKDGYF